MDEKANMRGTRNGHRPSDGREIPLPTVDQITCAWLVNYVPVKFWLWLLGILGAAFSAGVASSGSLLVQGLFAKHASSDLSSFVNKAVAEQYTYTIGNGADAIAMHVLDVSIARKMVTFRIGLVGHPKEQVDVALNQEKVIAIGSKAFILSVNDVSDVLLGPDIAVVSLIPKQQ